MPLTFEKAKFLSSNPDTLLFPKEDIPGDTWFEHNPVAHHEIDINGLIVRVNQRECDLLGYGRSEMIGRPVWHFVPETHQTESQTATLQKIHEIRPLQISEAMLQTATGESVLVEIREKLIRDARGVVIGISSVSLDIADRRQAEPLIGEQPKDLDTSTSSQMAEHPLLNPDLSGQLGARWRLERPVQHSEDRYREVDPQSGPSRYNTTVSGQFLMADASLIDMLGYGSFEELAAASVNCPRQIWDRQEFWIKIHDAGEVKHFDSTWYRADGTALRVRENARIVPDENGQPKYVAGSVQDITERRQSDEQLRQAQKMEAVGRLAAGVAHDFNNVLMVISGYSHMLLNQLPDCDPSREAIDEIAKAASRGATLTKQLLSFSRREAVRMETIDLNRLVSEMNNMLLRLIGENIHLSTLLHPDLSGIKGDPGQISQVVMNLAVNARDAMPAGGTLLIETFPVEIDEESNRNPLGLKCGPYVVLALSDNGCGMDSVTKTKIFEPFFTTKEAERGTGLGLATVYAIVKQAEGKIEVKSELGSGSSFRVYFPAVSVEPDGTKPVEVPLRIAEQTRTVLLVEDDEVVRTFMTGALKRLGYHVLEAESGTQALSISEPYREPIHLLLTDVVMPGVQGPELSRRITEQRPEIQTVFMSGYTDDMILRSKVSRTASFLRKPFTAHELGAKLQSIWA